VRAAGGQDVGRVGVEDAVVVGLAVAREDLADALVGLVAVRLQAALDHAPAAVRHDRPLQRRVRLQADDQLVRLVDVAGAVGGDRPRRRGVDVEDAAARTLLAHQLGHPLPQRLGPWGRPGEERPVSLVRRVVALDEVADVDRVPPVPGGEALPGRRFPALDCRRHDLPSFVGLVDP